MDGLFIHDTLSPGGQHVLPVGSLQVPQLPPQMFTTAASLLDLTDSEISQYPPFAANAQI